jgi:hypothetical protein
MLFIKKVLTWIPQSPVETILFTTSMILVLYAGYFALPFSLESTGVISVVFNTLQEHILISIALVTPGFYAMRSVFTKDYAKMHTASFAVMTAFAFLTLLRVFTFGFIAVNGWLLFWYPTLIATVCYLYFGWKTKKR